MNQQWDILRAAADRAVFGQHFQRSKTWDAWFAFLAALFALPMSNEQLAIYQKHTGRNTVPTTACHEAWLVCGRRAGKSFMLAVVAVFLACFKDWRPYLGPGEVGTIMVIAQDRRGARTVMRFVLGLLQSVPMLKRQIVSTTQESVTLKNNVVIEIHTASFRSTRGYTILAALLDEIAYWPVDETAAEQDSEVINAIKPGMATIPEAIMLCASSPHARKGALWEAYSKHYGKDADPVLLWQAATRDMNQTVPQSYIDQHMAEDAARASAEYGAQFRGDLERFVSREVVQAAVNVGVYERAYDHTLTYAGFVDPSGGSADSMTLAIAHFDYARQAVVLDCLREVRPPFSPEAVTQEFCQILASYQLKSVVGDRYAGVWPIEMFQRFGVIYEQAARPKAELYQALLPLLNSGRIDLLDHSKLVNQLLGLERNTTRGGRDHIDHAPGGHDDTINAVAGVAMQLNNVMGGYNYNMSSWLGEDEPNSRSYAAQQLAGFLQGMVQTGGGGTDRRLNGLFGPRQMNWNLSPYQSPFRR